MNEKGKPPFEIDKRVSLLAQAINSATGNQAVTGNGKTSFRKSESHWILFERISEGINDVQIVFDRLVLWILCNLILDGEARYRLMQRLSPSNGEAYNMNERPNISKNVKLQSHPVGLLDSPQDEKTRTRSRWQALLSESKNKVKVSVGEPGADNSSSSAQSVRVQERLPHLQVTTEINLSSYYRYWYSLSLLLSLCHFFHILPSCKSVIKLHTLVV